MSNLRTDFNILHKALLDAFLAKVASGEATAADLSAARQFLRDNGVGLVPDSMSGLKELESKLPFQTNEEAVADSLYN